MASQERGAGAQSEGYVAIDFGSTGTRVTAVTRQFNHESNEREFSPFYTIQDTRADDDIDKRFDCGEFPSVGCPFDGPPFLVGYNAASQTAKRTVSLKSLVYFLNDSEDEHSFTEALRVHYDLLSPAQKTAFRGHLRDMLSEYFTAIVDKILTKAQEELFDVRCITICIPNTWSTPENKFQVFLSDLLDEIVSDRNIEVTFTFEAAARAQYLLSQHWGHLRGHNYLLVLDFGGHSLGGAFGEIRWKKNGRPAMYSPHQSEFGIRGGYEIWEIEVGKAIDKQMTKDRNAQERFPEEHRATIRAAFLDKFFRDKAHLPLTKPKYRLVVNLQDTLGDSEKHAFAIELPVQVLKDAWSVAYRPALDLAKQHIEYCAARKGIDGVFVLLSGGSIANLEAKNEILDYCNTWGRLRSHGTTKTKMTAKVMKEIHAVGWKWSITQGAADCLAKTMDAVEFFDKGAALAIQSSTWKGNMTLHTSDGAKLLYCKEAGAEKRISVGITPREKKVIRLIADPDYVNHESESESLETVAATSCYDIWDVSFEYERTPGVRPLSRIPDGHYIIDVSDMKYDGWDAVLTLRLRPDNSPAKRAARRAKGNANDLDEDAVLYFEVPLVSHGESNLVVLDQDRIKDRCWKLTADARPGTKKQPSVGVCARAKPVKPATSGARNKRRRGFRPVMDDTDSEWEEEADGNDASHDTYDGRPAKRVSMADM